MTARVAITYLDSERDEGELKSDSWFNGMLKNTHEAPGGAASTNLTIASGQITPTGTLHTVSNEGAAATDDLNLMSTTNHPDGRWVVLKANVSSQVPIVRDTAGGAGQFHLTNAIDYALDSADKAIAFHRKGNDWHELWRASNPQSLATYSNSLCPHDDLTVFRHASDNDICTINADGLILTDEFGQQVRVDTVAENVDIDIAGGVNGRDAGSATQNVWWHLYVTYNPASALVSALCTQTYGAPTLPSGYRYKGYVGSAFYETGGSFRNFSQAGNTAFIPNATIVSAGGGTGKILLSTSTYIPVTAKEVLLSAGVGNTTFDLAKGNVSPGTTTLGEVSLTDARSSSTGVPSLSSVVLPLLTQSVYYENDTSNDRTTVEIYGYRY